MSTWTLIQIVFNIFMALGLFVVIMRMNRAPKDDPRLSRGLQLLQSKISVLEDLSDRTEIQVNQLTAILGQKAREVQAKVQLAEQHVHEIRVAMDRSLEVSKIFQDKIPHEEIIERQNTLKYVQAARLAHQGMSVDEITAQVDLPKGEIEFIAKVNRDQLTFSEEQLPWWAKSNGQTEAAAPGAANLVENLSRIQDEMHSLDVKLARDSSVRDMSQAFEVPKVETASLDKLGEEFRRACQAVSDAENKKDSRSPLLPPLEQLTSMLPQIFSFDEDRSSTGETTASSAASVTDATGATDASPKVSSLIEQAAASLGMTAPSPSQAAPAAAAPLDPVLARELAQRKVQAALQSGLQSYRPQSQSQTQTQNQAHAAPQALAQESSELAAARALARDFASMPAPPAELKVPAQPISPVINAKSAAAAAGGSPSANAPVIRKVEFPKISDPGL